MDKKIVNLSFSKRKFNSLPSNFLSSYIIFFSFQYFLVFVFSVYSMDYALFGTIFPIDVKSKNACFNFTSGYEAFPT